MKVEIWSDIICPFCYIGKRRFEQALANFTQKENIEIVWRSYQLDPEMKYVPGQSVHAYLAMRKGVSEQEGKRMNDYMSNMAREVGLQYDFDKAVVANTLDAHRLSHLALKHGLQDEAEERLFKAYFTEGQNIGDVETLVKLGEEIGLNGEEVRQMLQSDTYQQEVQQDIYEAQQVGVRGVPFFVLDGKFAVSGAQPAEVFEQALQHAWQEHEKTKPLKPIGNAGADACGIDGSNC